MKTIVAEVSKNWKLPLSDEAKIGGESESASGPLCVEFERVIAINEARGYVLDSWQFRSVCYQASELGEPVQVITETVLAVFKSKPENSPAVRPGYRLKMVKLCPKCKGKGKIGGSGEKFPDCEECGGTGDAKHEA